ncbi:hypothetical protein RWV98_00835 [Agathobaculum sp. NTUH-O15-33]|uniref:hypothetical protein n=1 Tax=Agathobaculum sp. NTUH-O15-33 TaxID=3079302 RepID=UPI00295864A1|nr:hypothetical protein [Agathobaculum sp. NTUH-O15-33]WNX84848.1 hypothetical protein RWV98_00835 [Agathobaculum sp. NTUH-O15-33]
MDEKTAHGGVIGVTDEGYPIVTEDYGCPHWVGSGGPLANVRECWYCKYADFRKSTELHMRSSICRCMENRVDIKFGFTKNET